MRAVRAGVDAAFVGWGYVVIGAVGIVVGLTVDADYERALWFLLANLVAWTGVMALAARDVKRAARAPAEIAVEPLRRTAAWLALLLIVFLFVAVVVESAEFATIWLGSGIASIGLSIWMARFERRTGHVVLRRLWTFSKKRYVLQSQEDTAPAQRKTAHAQSEAARRAP